MSLVTAVPERQEIVGAGRRTQGQAEAGWKSGASGRFGARVMQEPTLLLDRLADCWEAPGLAGPRGVVVFFALLTVLCGARGVLGLSATRVYSHDGFLILDGAWRMLNGQRPHVDFNSMVGPYAYLPTVLLSKLTGDVVTGFGWGQAVAAFLLGLWAYALGRVLTPVPRLLFASCTAIIAGSPALIGASPFDLSPGMTYNRYTYALLGLVLLECAREPEGAEFLAGFSSGAAFGIMAFLKMTGVVIEGMLLVSLWPMRRQSGRRWAGIVCGTLATAIPALAYLHFQVGRVWEDLRMTAAAKHVVLYDHFDFTSLFFEAAFGLLLVVAAAELLRGRGKPREARRLLWLAAVTVVVSVGLILGNYQRASMPLATVMLILCGDSLLRQVHLRSGQEQRMRSLVLSGASVFVAGVVFSVMASLLAGIALQLFTAPRRPHFHAEALHRFVPVAEDVVYTRLANDGFDLLARYRRPGERVMSLDFTNPFSVGLRIPPAPGGTTNLQYRGSFDDWHKLPPQRLFGSAELVMLPLVFSDASLAPSVDLNYGDYLHEHYALVGETKQWQLYRRKP